MMFKQIPRLIAIAGILMMLAAPTNGQDSDLLFAEDFETGTSAPDGWSEGAAIPGVKYVYDKSSGNSGKRSLSLQKSANRYFPIAQWYRTISHDADQSNLTVVAQVRAEQSTKSKLDLSFIDGFGKVISHDWALSVGGTDPANHDWKQYSNDVAIPDGTKQIRVALQIYGPGKVWIDDISITYGKSNASENDTAGSAQATQQPESNEVKIGKHIGNYLFVDARAEQEPEDGYGLLLVLPGGSGSADFHPFVKNIHANALGDDFVLAQPLAKKWTEDQQIVWPTAKNKVKKMGYTTERLVESIVKDIAKQKTIDPKRVYILGWSSGGPAVWSILLKRKTSVTGGFIAMSVFKPKLLSNPKYAKGRSIYIFHSPNDRVCPYWMAESGEKALSDAGVRTTLVDYQGGHGWHGDVFGNLRAGFKWLENPDENESR